MEVLVPWSSPLIFKFFYVLSVSTQVTKSRKETPLFLIESCFDEDDGNVDMELKNTTKMMKIIPLRNRAILRGRNVT